jgi:hypothetical protein
VIVDSGRRDLDVDAVQSNVLSIGFILTGQFLGSDHRTIGTVTLSTQAFAFSTTTLTSSRDHMVHIL